MKKKILFIVTKGNFGGAQRYVHDLAVNLPQSEYETIVACGKEGELVERLRAEAIPVFLIHSLGRDISLVRDVRSFFEIQTIMRKMRPDVVHLNSSKAAALGALAARLLGISRVIATIHGWPFRERRNILWRGFAAFSSWLTALFATNVICVSSSDRSAARWMPFVQGKFAVIHNGISLFEMYSRAEARGKIADDTRHSNDMWVGTIAELHASKDHLTALKAVAEFNSIHSRKIFYCIIGDGEKRADMQRWIEEHGIVSNVALLGHLKNARAYLPAFDFFLFLSIKEGLPYSVLEAGAAGLPVIATGVGGIPEIIEDGESGYLVAPGDTIAIVDALERVIEDDRMRMQFAGHLRERIKTLFSLKQMIEETVRLY